MIIFVVFSIISFSKICNSHANYVRVLDENVNSEIRSHWIMGFDIKVHLYMYSSVGHTINVYF